VSLPTKQRLLESIKKKDVKDTKGLPTKIIFKLGIKYMITSNVGVEDGLVNGAKGVLRHVNFEHESTTVSKIRLEFFGKRQVGVKARRKYENFVAKK